MMLGNYDEWKTRSPDDEQLRHGPDPADREDGPGEWGICSSCEERVHPEDQDRRDRCAFCQEQEGPICDKCETAGHDLYGVGREDWCLPCLAQSLGLPERSADLLLELHRKVAPWTPHKRQQGVRWAAHHLRRLGLVSLHAPPGEMQQWTITDLGRQKIDALTV